MDSSRLAINMGTSGALRALTRDTPAAPELFRYALDGATSVVGGALANGGNAYAWLQRTLAPDEKLSRQVDRIAPDGHGLTILPFWAGERSPGWHSDARAVIAGLNLHTTPAEIVRATLESITYTLESVREPLSKLLPDASEIVASGGALRHEPGWPQMMADVFGTPVVLSRVAEASSRGAALLAARKLGLLDDLRNASSVLGRRCRPIQKNRRIYGKAIERYGKLYASLIGEDVQ